MRHHHDHSGVPASEQAVGLSAVVLADNGSGLLAPIPNAPARYPFALTAARSFSIVECRGSMPASSILETVDVGTPASRASFQRDQPVCLSMALTSFSAVMAQM